MADIVPIPQQFNNTVFLAATQYGLSPAFLAGIIMRESSWDTTAHNPSGAHGLGQFLPGTAAQYGVNVNDGTSSIYGVAHYISDLIKQNSGNVQNALRDYGGFVTADPSGYIGDIGRYQSQYAAQGIGNNGAGLATDGNSTTPLPPSSNGGTIPPSGNATSGGLAGIIANALSSGGSAVAANINNSLVAFWNEHYAAGIFLVLGIGFVSVAVLGLALKASNSPTGTAATAVVAPEVAGVKIAQQTLAKPAQIRPVTAATNVRSS